MGRLGSGLASWVRYGQEYGLVPGMWVIASFPTGSVWVLSYAQWSKLKIRDDGTVYQLWAPTGGCGPPSVFLMKLVVWERWISIIGGAGTAFSCVQWQQSVFKLLINFHESWHAAVFSPSSNSVQSGQSTVLSKPTIHCVSWIHYHSSVSYLQEGFVIDQIRWLHCDEQRESRSSSLNYCMCVIQEFPCRSYSM